MNNENNIFRKDSLNRVSSPDELNDYIKVSRPSVWLILIAVIILLVGVCVWGVFGTMTTSQKVATVVKDGKAVCYVAVENVRALEEGMKVQIGDSVGSITSIAVAPVEITTNFESLTPFLGALGAGDWGIPVSVDIAAENGVYMAEIIQETIAPISFLLN